MHWALILHHNLPVDCAKELFKPSRLSKSSGLQQKKFCFFVIEIISEVGFWPFLAQVTWPGPKPLDRIILLKFSMETMLESVSFEPVVNFLEFLLQKLWSKINKLIDSLIMRLITHIAVFRT